jgi:DNA mismatch repair ATPase MutS
MNTKIFDKILTRMGNDDDFESSASTFHMEMREMAYALLNISNDSLLIIDELGRGTSNIEGLAISTSICEELLKKTKVRGYF